LGVDNLSAETHYLNALEALDAGDRSKALEEAKIATSLDPEHTEAWSIYVEATVPARGEQMTMLDAAQALAAVKKIVALDPTRLDMWLRGGRLMADDLGLLHDALHWWQKCRNYTPNEATPLVEMASILADMGEYEEAQRRLEAILEENMDVPTSQFTRINGLLNLVRAAAVQDSKEIFRPYEKHHNGWEAIRQKMKKPPMSENFIFLMVSVPLLLVVIYFSQQFAGQGWGSFCLTTMVILFIVLFSMRTAKRWFQLINRPAFNLLRAMNFEASTGHTVLQEDIRTSVLYMYIMQRKPRPWQERMLKIIDRGVSLPKNWKQRLPDFEAHHSFIDDYVEEDDNEGLRPYEEE